MPSKRNIAALLSVSLVGAGVSLAQTPPAPESSPQQAATKPPQPAFIPPGKPGSPINGELFHAQVLMSAHAFSPGVIDGKKGESFRLALRSFQLSRGLDTTGELDDPTKRALMQAGRPSTVMVRLGTDDVRSEYVYPFPENPEQQAELKFLGYRNTLEKLAERYHTTPRTIVALNGPDKPIGLGQTLRLPNVIPSSRDYSDVQGSGARTMAVLNVDARQPKGDYVVVDKSEGVLKVFRKAESGDQEDSDSGQLVAAFPVTMGSKQYPLPIGRWKVTTYAFLPPFHYQPAILVKPKTDKELTLPPGPNGPVGVAWLDLTKEHYGIHGTSEPQTIGRAESSGCIRMTNWDVLRLSRIMKPGFTAVFQA